MKNRFTYLIPVIIYCVITANMMITGCTKEGPAGPPGADGQDASESCTSCHNFSEFLLEKIYQHNNSTHASGANLSRSGNGCSQCHTSQGFTTFLADGTTNAVQNPNPINCRTCHPIHESYDAAKDFNVRSAAAVTMIVGGGSYDFGNSNLCANCHQARAVTPYPVAGGENVTITNARYGPHYSPQSNVLIGNGPFEIPGALQYANSPHGQIADGCITCHMGNTANGLAAGGHQMNVTYTGSNGNDAWNYSGCTECHPSATDLATLRAQHREEIKTLQYALRDKLIEKGLLNQAELVPVPITVTPNEAGAIMNYKFAYGDHSYGAHNYPYMKALLTNSIAALN